MMCFEVNGDAWKGDWQCAGGVGGGDGIEVFWTGLAGFFRIYRRGVGRGGGFTFLWKDVDFWV